MEICKYGICNKISVPTIIIGDIDRGGVIASLVGKTKAVLDSEDNKSLIGFIIKDFVAILNFLKNGILEIEKELNGNFGFSSILRKYS
ncbi:MAG: hypothetical protein CM15mP73_0420 [Hyphomicrobiales bacterium]|nr:MAG: hypothetical protein CM15mP73_0420 [Hyphomicrobiales bacterium]